MRGGQPAVTLSVVSISEPVQVLLEIQPAEATVSGRLAVEGAPVMTFYGWLELIDRLERAVQPQMESSRASPERTRPAEE